MAKPNNDVEYIKITGDEKFQSVPLDSITIVERPKTSDASKVMFFNPRDTASFEKEEMELLAHSIRTEGLQTPPLVRAIGSENRVTKLELIAGERRIRSCRYIVENNLPCYSDTLPRPDRYELNSVVMYKGRFGTVVGHNQNSCVINFDDDPIGEKGQRHCQLEDVYPTIDGSELFKDISCKVVYNCSDERALRLAFCENDKSKPLTIIEEVALVERLEKMGKKQDEIAELLGTNVTWVSQTSNFRQQLPAGAFEKLAEGKMARHVAVSFLSYSNEDRDSLYQASIEAEKIETEEKILTHRANKEQLEDQEELMQAEASEAETDGDNAKAEKARRKAAVLAQKAEKEAERLNRAKKESGTIKKGHVKQGANKSGIAPKKAKPLDSDDIEEIYVKAMAEFLDGTGIDEETGMPIPAEYAAIVRRTALAILSRNRDPLQPIREYMRDSGLLKNEATTTDEDIDSEDFPIEAFNNEKSVLWTTGEEDEDEDEDDDEEEEEDLFADK